MIPRSTKLTSINDLPSHLNGITFPLQTILLDAGAVKKQLPFIDYAYVSSWGVVSMPKQCIAQFLTEATIIPTRPDEIKECRDWVLEAPQRQHFRSDEWQAASAKNYKVWWFAGKSISILADLDNPSTARVYMNLN